MTDYFHRNKNSYANRTLYDLVEKNVGGVGAEDYVASRCGELGITVDVGELKSAPVKVDGAFDTGIIYIDEIDKLRTTSSNADVNTTQVQNGLLKIIEGTEIRLDGGGTPPPPTRFGQQGGGGGGSSTPRTSCLCARGPSRS